MEIFKESIKQISMKVIDRNPLIGHIEYWLPNRDSISWPEKHVVDLDEVSSHLELKTAS